MTALRFALIGAGQIAQSYIQAFNGFAPGRIVAVADPEIERAAAAASLLDSKAFGSHSELIADVACDAAIVCTPPATHVDVALDLVAHGVAVLCEKPLTLDLPSAVKLVTAAADAGVQLTMAAKFRYVDAALAARELMDMGEVGELVAFDNVFASRVPMAGRWNADPSVSGGGVLIDNGTHSVDIARYFLGSIREVMAVAAKRVQDVPVEDTAQMHIRTHDGAHGTIDLSWSIHKEVDSYISIYGSQGTINVGWRESKYRTVTSHDWITFAPGYDKVRAMRKQLLNFCAAYLGREPLRITAEDAVASVAVIKAAYESLEQARWVPIDEASALT
jgi:predicted dehydrogenase